MNKLSHVELGRNETYEDTFQRLRDDEELYDSACLRIRNKRGELVPLDWNFAQRFVAGKLREQWEREGRIRAVILKARQEGVSTYVAGRFFRKVNLYAGVKGLIIANALENAEAIFGIYERYHLNLPAELQPDVTTRASLRALRYAHDSSLAVRPASDKNAGRAQTLHLLHASEIAFWPEGQQRDVWVSATSAVPEYGTEIIVESTPNGAGGLFYELWEDATTPGSGWLGIFLPWWIHEEYDCDYEGRPPLPDEIEAIATAPDDFEENALGEGIPWEGKHFVLPLTRLVWRRRKIINQFGGDPETLGEDATREFQQEFPATAEEAFIASGAMYFDDMKVRDLAQKTKDPIMTGKMVENYVQVLDEKKRVISFQKSPRGFVRIWEEPTHEPERPRAGEKVVLEHYAIGCDTAEGKMTVKASTKESSGSRDDRDYSAGAVVTVPARGGAPRLVATIHGWIPADVLAKQLALLGEWYSCGGKYDVVPTRRAPAKIMVESNHASGQRVLLYLKEVLRYSNMYWQRTFNTRTNTFEPKIGWRTDERSRDILLDGLGELIRYERIIIPDAATVKELGQFVYDKTGKVRALEGAHDDRVFSLSLAVQTALKEHRHAVTSSTPTTLQIEEVTGAV